MAAYGGGVQTLDHIPARPVTYEEWLGMGETNLPVDVVDGVVIVSPAPAGVHQTVVENVFKLLLGVCPAGTRAAVAPRDWVLWQLPLRVRQPDVMIIADDQARAPRLSEPPLLAVEVISPTSREQDLVHKPADYAEAGLQHLWLVDPALPEVVVRRWDGNEWGEVGRAAGDEVLDVSDPVAVSLRPSDLLA